MQMTLERPQTLFAILGEPVRLRLACCLLAAPEGLCVCELVEALNVSQPNVSQHLRLMKSAGLAEERREGRWIYYRLKNADHPFFSQIRCCIETVCCCPDVQDDMRRLRARLKKRRGGRCVVGFSNQTRRGR